MERKIPVAGKIKEKRACPIARTILILGVFFSLVWFGGVAVAAEIVRVKVKEANVRKGPGTHFDRVWRVPMNYPYRVLERRGDWLKVSDFDGYEEWIYGPLTDRKPAIVVKVKRANIRGGPGTNHPILFSAEKGVPFFVLKKEGKWLKVRHADGDEGWIFEELAWGNIP